MSLAYLELETRLEQAVHFITKAILSREKYRGMFLLHSIRVGLYLQAQGYDEETVLAGFLHDLIEDTPVTLAELEAIYDESITRIVAANTDNMELPTLERSHEKLARCLAYGKAAVLVTAADFRDNLQTYLPSANPDMMDWLKSYLKHFLAETQSMIGDEPVWNDIREQHNALLTDRP